MGAEDTLALLVGPNMSGFYTGRVGVASRLSNMLQTPSENDKLNMHLIVMCLTC